MNLHFAKMHALGNDFMVVDGISQNVLFSDLQIKKLADRHRGIGFDQLLLIEPPLQHHIDFHYRIFNADASEVEQCGNGARCVALFVKKMKLTWKNHFKMSTKTSFLDLHLMQNDLVSVNMGIPQIAFNNEEPSLPIEEEIHLSNHSLPFHFVSLGNPHCVIDVDKAFTQDLTSTFIHQIAQEINQHPRFPKGVNVGFMKIKSNNEIRLRVFERGVGETQACGTGACASMVVGRLLNKVRQKTKVFLLGGHLNIDWNGAGQSLKMIGPASFIYQGSIRISQQKTY
jgi:diaminopimelate epimerase